VRLRDHYVAPADRRNAFGFGQERYNYSANLQFRRRRFKPFLASNP